MSKNIAKILPDLSLDKEFDYLIPKSLADTAKPGCRVVIPFGRTTRKGYIISLSDKTECPLEKLKEIISVDSHLIPENLMKLGEWISSYYCASRIRSIRSLLPAPVRNDKVQTKFIRVAVLKEGYKMSELLDKYQGKNQARAEVIKVLFNHKECAISLLKKEAGVSDSPIKTLEKDGILEIIDKEINRDPFVNDKILPSQPHTLTEEQEASLKMVNESQNSPKKDVILLQGVTGCGKTEVYLQAIETCLKQGKEAIVLVPEISLTPQTVERFRARFGDIVGVMHSRLGEGERFDQWMKIYNQETKIAVGARSALFAPFKNLGLIVVDEEHENSYKQSESPRYQARDVAVMRAHMEKSTVILGTATPSLESLYNVSLGKYKKSIISKRVDEQLMPKMEVVDMRNESAALGQPQIFSRRLISEIHERLNSGYQIMLFLNRRGFATQMQCLECGFVAKCKQCDCAYTFHRANGILICHYCSDLLKAPSQCPECSDPQIKFKGLGTEKIEDIANKLFPRAQIARMDSDSMTRKDSHKNLLESFRHGDIDILIGTQMIAKGLHFPRVTLVGILVADMSLNIPDFRASERTFQLLTQVSGRAGRGDEPGLVIVQTYTPFHPALQFAVNHELDEFFEDELEGRKIMNLPPFKAMITIHFRGEDEEKLNKISGDFTNYLREHIGNKGVVSKLVPSPIKKIRNKLRYQISINSDSNSKLVPLIRNLTLNSKFPKDIQIFADIDPYSAL